ncbi:MAG: translation initiation factor IF-3 [Deltaproteobacteria bacterium]|nr:translation initiation factor IF-3 [Deltaproteobacteria bacterium]
MEIIGRSIAYRFDKVRIVGSGMNEIVTIRDAMTRAEELGLDLVMVSPEAKPPVVRIEDFKKLEYEKKKAKKAKKQPVSSLKEIQFKVNISEHDLATKLAKINKFLERGDKVKVSIKLKGRERENPERAHELLEKVVQAVDCKVNRIPGPIAMLLLEPVKKTKK